jgi:VanZ family protein
MQRVGRRSRAWLWILSGGSVIPVLLLSLGLDPGLTSGLWDRVGHALGYAALTGSSLFAGVWSPGRGYGPFRSRAAVIVAAAIGLGLLIEIAQVAFHRDTDLVDALANATGALLAFAVWQLLRWRLSA